MDPTNRNFPGKGPEVGAIYVIFSVPMSISVTQMNPATFLGKGGVIEKVKGIQERLTLTKSRCFPLGQHRTLPAQHGPDPSWWGPHLRFLDLLSWSQLARQNGEWSQLPRTARFGGLKTTTPLCGATAGELAHKSTPGISQIHKVKISGLRRIDASSAYRHTLILFSLVFWRYFEFLVTTPPDLTILTMSTSGLDLYRSWRRFISLSCSHKVNKSQLKLSNQM